MFQFVFNNPVKVLFGPGQLQNLHKEKLPGSKALIATSNGTSVSKYGYLDALEKELDLAGVSYTVFDEVRPNPTDVNVMDGARRMKANGCDFIIALGGGSVMDCSKCIALMAANSGDIWDYSLSGKGGKRAPANDALPIVSFNFAYGSRTRCYETMKVSTIFGLALMAIGTLCFELIPREMLSLFTDDSSVLDIGTWAFRCIGWSFLPMVLSLTYPVYFEAIDRVLASSMLTILRTVVLFVPLGYLFSRYSLEAFWFTFLVTEIITASAGAVMYYREKRQAAKAG